MIEALHISESGLKATQEWLDMLSNNVANMHTAGYKKTLVSFNNLVSQAQAGAGLSNGAAASTTVPGQQGMGIKIGDLEHDFSPGTFKPTSRGLDIAINGKGFFEVIMEDGSLGYTRLGRFNVNSEGLLAIDTGQVLSDKIYIPDDVSQIEIKANGEIIGMIEANQTNLQLGQLSLANINDTRALTSVGDSLYSLDNEDLVSLNTPGENGTGNIQQGFIELSNVSLVDEMSNLVLAQRAYQLNARIIQTADQVLETINNLRR